MSAHGMYNSLEVNAKVRSSLQSLKKCITVIDVILEEEFFKDLDGKVMNVKFEREFRELEKVVSEKVERARFTNNVWSNWWLKVESPITFTNRFGHNETVTGDYNDVYILGYSEKNSAFRKGARFNYELFTEVLTSRRDTIHPLVEEHEKFIKDFDTHVQRVNEACNLLNPYIGSGSKCLDFDNEVRKSIIGYCYSK